jgi:hypothetical protein
MITLCRITRIKGDIFLCLIRLWPASGRSVNSTSLRCADPGVVAPR